MIKILHFNAGDAVLIPGQEAKIPHASWEKNKNIKKKKKKERNNIVTNSIKILKIVYIKKEFFFKPTASIYSTM